MKKSFIGLIGLLLSLAAVSTGCAKQNKNINEVRIAYFPNITHAQALVMKNKSILEDKIHIAVNWISFNAGPSEMEALFAGEVDIGYIGPVPAINGYVQSDGDVVIIAGATNGGSLLIVRKDSGIVKVSDLDGKTVAVPQFGNTQHLGLLQILNDNQLKPTIGGGTVKVVQSSNADILNLMDQKNIDAALVPEPWGSILTLDGEADILLDYDEIDGNGIPCTAVVVVRRDFLEAHPDMVQSFIEAHIESTEYINETPTFTDIVNTEIAAVTQSVIDEDVLRRSFERITVSYEIPAESIFNFAQLSMDAQFITNLPSSNLINDNFLK